MVKRPLKAPSKQATENDLDHFPYPGYVSPKLDGYCCLCEEGAFTSTLKPITNEFIQRILSNPIYNGLHGEIVVGAPNHPDAFNNTTGAVRRRDGKPNFKLYVYDDFSNLALPYQERYYSLLRRTETLLPFVKVVPQLIVTNKTEVKHFLQGCLDLDYEGAMLRTLDGPYKQGRCTQKEGYIFKLKPNGDAECRIVGFVEKLKNNNIATTNELGLSRRSSHRDNKEGAGTLGGLRVVTLTEGLPWTGKEITIGTGTMKHDEAYYIYTHQAEFMNAIGVYKYQEVGSIDLPRQPIWKGFRDKDDITNF